MKKFIITALALAPAIASAQGPTVPAGPTLSNLGTLLESIGNLVSLALPIVVAIGLLVFFWGLVTYIFSEAKEKGTKLMIWGIVALFVMVSVWGLVRFIGSAFGVTQGGSTEVPTVTGLIP